MGGSGGGFFTFTESRYAAECRQLATQELQAREVHYGRSIWASGAGFAASLTASVTTMGATLPLSAVSARMLDVARGKYKMIQLELVDRCVQLHENTWGDRTKGLSAFGAAYVATMGIGSGAGAEGPATELVEVAWEYIKWIPGEIVNAVSLRVTDRLPSRKCPRVKRYKHLRLRCAVCLDCFDTSYVEFLHCCDCDDLFDVCATCALSLQHDMTHMLHKMPPSCPRIPSSWRSTLGRKLSCSECKVPMADTDYYSCGDCYRQYSICLGCYTEGRWCRKHQEPLDRRHAKA